MRLRVLIVDDSPHDRAMVRRELNKEFDDIMIIEVTNESEFRAVVAEVAFDVVITDFHIRWTDGLKVLSAVKARLPDCPVLMFTATGNEEVAVDAMKAGLDDYIIKNVRHLVRLSAAIRAALDHSRTRVRADRLEDRLASLLSQLRLGVLRRNRDGQIIEANNAAAEILGIGQSADLIGKRITDFLDSDAGNPLNQEMIATRADGTSIWLTINEREVFEDPEALLEGILEDVTIRRNAEDEFRLMQDEIAHVARVNTMSELASGIAHELKQPLHAIVGFTEASINTLKRDYPDADGVLEMMGKVRDLAFQSGQVIKGLQDFTRPQARSHEPTKLGKLIQRTIEMLQFEMRRSRVRVTFQTPNPDVLVTADRVQIQQVLVNLVSNAIDSMTSCDINDRVLSIQTDVQQDTVEVCVIDNGQGIDSDQMDRLFDPYVSSKNSGSGIGLSISARIIEVHGGALDAWNNADLGATFRFTLPITVAQSCQS